MKPKHFLLALMTSVIFMSCSKEATDAANDGDVDPSSINGTWRETTTGVTVSISGVSSTSNGTGYLTDCGTVYPSGALGGTVMTVVEYQSGRYWDAYNNTYYSNGTWSQASVIGLTMNENMNEFLIGSKVYVRQ